MALHVSLTRLPGGSALAVWEVGGDGDDGVPHGLPDERLGGGLELTQHHGRDLQRVAGIKYNRLYFSFLDKKAIESFRNFTRYDMS